MKFSTQIAVIFSLITLYSLKPALANEWFEGSGEVAVVNITPEQARNRAFERARVDALAKARIEVTGVQARQMSESEGSSYDNFINFTVTRTSGLILEVDTLFDETVTIAMTDGMKMLTHRAKIRAKIQTKSADPDPEFQLTFKTDSELYRSGQEMQMLLTATKDCYITILNLYSNDSLAVIFPNQVMTDNHLEKGDTLLIPPENAYWSLPVYLGQGKSEDREGLLAVATKKDQRMRMGDITVREGLLAQSDALLVVNRWLADVDADKRTEAWLFYRVIKD